MERIVIGTAQLGMEYGIANHTGQPDFDTTKSIIKTAWESGVREYDTAQAYGESEPILGKALKELGINDKVKIISKFHFGIDHLNKNELLRSLEKTLSNLNIPRLYCIMLHREELLNLWGKGLSDSLSGFISSGLVEHLGVSIYSIDKAIKALETTNISFVQLPSNLLEHGFEKNGVFKLANESRKHIYIRSVFLQGLLLMDSDNLPVKMNFAADILWRFDNFCKNKGISKKHLALLYMKQKYPNAKIIIGVETAEQLKENLEIWNDTLPLNIIEEIDQRFDDVDDVLLNPFLWPK